MTQKIYNKINSKDTINNYFTSACLRKKILGVVVWLKINETDGKEYSFRVV
jgi:hypothetical protein